MKKKGSKNKISSGEIDQTITRPEIPAAKRPGAYRIVDLKSKRSESDANKDPS